MQENNAITNNNSSLPSLPLSLRSSFLALPGGVRGVVRGYMHRLFQSLWPFRTYLAPESFPTSFIFLVPGVLTSLELNIHDVSTLQAVYFLSEGGKRGVLAVELIDILHVAQPNRTLSRLKQWGYLRRASFDPLHPLPSKEKYSQHRYIFITAEGVQVLQTVHNKFRSEFYGVINRAAFGADNKKPGST